LALYIVLQDFVHYGITYAAGTTIDSTTNLGVSQMLIDRVPIMYASVDVLEARDRTAYLKMDTVLTPPVLDVRTFGAAGDGIQDDAPAIRAAATVAFTMGTVGGVVFFPRGNYRCATSIVLAGGPNLDQLYFVGEGKSVIYFDPGAGLSVDGGIAPAVNQYLTLRNLVFSRSGGLGIGAVVKIKRAAHVRIVDCDFAAGAQSLWIDDCADVIVRGCFFGELCVTNLLLLTNCLFVDIVENFFENVQPGSGAHVELQAENRYVSIASNRFNDGLQGIRSGVGGTGAFDCAITGNVFGSACASGIRIAGGEAVAVTGNSMKGTGGAGTGILLEATSTRVAVAANTVHAYATALISDLGAANVVASNIAY
jgi:polygalacturonase